MFIQGGSVLLIDRVRSGNDSLTNSCSIQSNAKADSDALSFSIILQSMPSSSRPNLLMPSVVIGRNENTLFVAFDLCSSSNERTMAPHLFIITTLSSTKSPLLINDLSDVVRSISTRCSALILPLRALLAIAGASTC